jgi:hypothetical protein
MFWLGPGDIGGDGGMETERLFRVVTFSRLAPYALMRLISRIQREIPEVRVCQPKCLPRLSN